MQLLQKLQTTIKAKEDMRLNYAKLTGFTSRPIVVTRRRNGVESSAKTYSIQNSVDLIPPPEDTRRASIIV